MVNKPKPIAFRAELIRLILKYFTHLSGVEGPYHISGRYTFYFPGDGTQGFYQIFRAVNAKGHVKEARITLDHLLYATTGCVGLRVPGVKTKELTLKEVKELIEKIKSYANRNKATDEDTGITQG